MNRTDFSDLSIFLLLIPHLIFRKIAREMRYKKWKKAVKKSMGWDESKLKGKFISILVDLFVLTDFCC